MNIVLIWMPWAWKSTIWVLLAKTLGKSFIDTDLLIQQYTWRLLQDIIDNDWLDLFLQIEEKVIINNTYNNSVIATWWSVVYSDICMNYLKNNSKITYLKLDLEEIEKRINNITTRWVAIKSWFTMQDLFDERVPLYEKYSDLVIDCHWKTPEQINEEIFSNINL